MKLLYLVDSKGFDGLTEKYEPRESMLYYIGYKLAKQDFITTRELQRETGLSEELIKEIVSNLEKELIVRTSGGIIMHGDNCRELMKKLLE